MLQLRGAVQALRQDCHSLAGAVDRLSAGADVGEVLRALPPTLVQVRAGRRPQLVMCLRSRYSGGGRRGA